MTIERPQHYTFENGEFVVVYPVDDETRELHPLPAGFWTEDGQKAMDWDDEAEAIVPLLQEWKDRTWEKVKEHRHLIEQEGVAPTPFGAVQCDDGSKIKISGLVQMAQIALSLSQPFEQAFTLADNSEIVLNAEEMIALGVAVGQHVAAIHARSQALRAEINAATAVAEVLAIDITGGWPSPAP